jgi:hypothetical protein
MYLAVIVSLQSCHFQVHEQCKNIKVLCPSWTLLIRIRSLLKSLWTVIPCMLHLWQLSLDVLGYWVRCFCLMICCVVLVVDTCGPHPLVIHSAAYIHPLLCVHIVIGEKHCIQQTRWLSLMKHTWKYIWHCFY